MSSKPQRGLRSSKSDSNEGDIPDDQIDRLWSKLEQKLNNWMEKSLPAILKTPEFLEVTKQTIKTYTSHVSSPEFISCLGESILFDTKNLEDKINDQQQTIVDLQQNLAKTESDHDDLEQYTRRTNIRIFGIPEDQEVSTDNQVLEFLKTELGIELNPNDISRSHRIGAQRTTNTKPRPIIVRFTKHNTKVEILRQRRKLKVNRRPFAIYEDLTKSRRLIIDHLHTNARDKIEKVWTIDGTIFFRPKSRNTTVERCTTMKVCQGLLAKY